MAAILFLLLCCLVGHLLRRRLLPPAHELLRRYGERPVETARRFPALLFDLPASFLLGLLPLTTLLYFLACFCRAHSLQIQNNSVKAADLLLLLLLAPCLLLLGFFKWKQLKHCHWSERKRQSSASAFTVTPKNLRPFLAALFFAAAFIYALNYFVFFQDGAAIYSGRSVVSDYSAHIATISSFARGENFTPTDYPFFGGAGIRYHFFFYFCAANLNVLGLSLPAALNLLSALSLLCFSSFAGLLAIYFSGRSSAFFWVQPLLYWQSSLSSFDFLRQAAARAAAKRESLFSVVMHNRTFSGPYEKDRWGLWNLNVWANQRHLALAIAVLLFVLILMLPSMRRANLRGQFIRHLRLDWLRSSAWLPQRGRPGTGRFAAALLLMLCLPYWHGAILIALWLLLFLCALGSREKLGYLALALASVLAALFFTRYFVGAVVIDNAAAGSSGQGAALPGDFHLRFLWGFISPDLSFGGVLHYLWETLGLALPCLIILPFFQRSHARRLLSLSFILPLIFALTVSLTPDVTVNHKYIILSRLLGCFPLTACLCALWHGGAALKRLRRPAGAVLAVALGLLLTLSGLLDSIAYRNQNQLRFPLRTDSAFVEWLEQKTAPRDLFLTPQWFYHPFFYSGRQTFYGYPYFAWSAGYDTPSREALWRELWSGCNENTERFKFLCRTYKLRYALVTDELRKTLGAGLDEDFFRRLCPLAAEFPAQDHLTVYDLRAYD